MVSHRQPPPPQEDSGTETSADSKASNSPFWNDSIFSKLEDMICSGLAYVNIPINPGHVLLTMSLLSAYSAGCDLQLPKEQIVVPSQELEPSVPLNDASCGSVKTSNGASAARRPVVVSHSAVVSTANRAFRIATKGNIAFFGILGAVLCYSSGCDSLEKTSQNLKRWARPKRLDVDALPFSDFLKRWLPHQASPDVEVTNNMTEEEELEYISKKYFSSSELSDANAENESN